jgi:ABC-2 type transport system permease protein
MFDDAKKNCFGSEISDVIPGELIISVAIFLPVLIFCTLAHVVSPLANHWPAFVVLNTATALCASGLGEILGSLLHGSRVVAMAASVLATYLFFLGGGFTTIAFLPNWLQVVSSFIPTRYAIAGMRQILFYPDLIGVQHDLTVLIGAALGSVIPGSFR